DLPSGGYLIFDYAEAFTVIDVNTGRFVGSRSKKSGARLEDTITKNNLEAVKEVVRQLRLRDIGGIIVIDFIDMASPKNRAAVEKALGEELERDRTKTYVVEISPLGLVEMTRQNVTDGPREVMTKKCPTCGGDGIVVSEHTAAVDIERRLRSLVTPGSRSKAFKVEVAGKVAALVAGPGGTRLQELEETTKRRFFLVGKDGEHLDHFKVLDQGPLEKVAPSLPVDVGQEIDLKLGEVGLHDSQAGVGKVENVDVVVGGAAKLVGKKVRARITAVGDGIAWAELVSPVSETEPPLTAEAEAERPTRAPRKSAASKVAEDEPEAVVQGYGPEMPWRQVINGAILVRRGLPWVASNLDLTVPTRYGPGPGNGALVQLVAEFSGRTPVAAGKPEKPLFEESLARVGGERPLVVGDRIDTDIDGARAVGWDSLLVMTGVTTLEILTTLEPAHRPTYLGADLGALLLAPGDCGAWDARVVEGALVVTGSGDLHGWWTAVAAAVWAHLDDTGRPATTKGVVPGSVTP
ncbi:MAG: ribonuclease E/G, partial [Marmoricola sp.]